MERQSYPYKTQWWPRHPSAILLNGDLEEEVRLDATFLVLSATFVDS